MTPERAFQWLGCFSLAAGLTAGAVMADIYRLERTEARELLSVSRTLRDQTSLLIKVAHAKKEADPEKWVLNQIESSETGFKLLPLDQGILDRLKEKKEAYQFLRKQQRFDYASLYEKEVPGGIRISLPTRFIGFLATPSRAAHYSAIASLFFLLTAFFFLWSEKKIDLSRPRLDKVASALARAEVLSAKMTELSERMGTAGTSFHRLSREMHLLLKKISDYSKQK